MKRLLLLLPLAWLCASIAAHAADPPPDLRPRLEALSARGNGEAAYHLGMIHHLGLLGTPKDPRKAFALFRLAAERGDPLGAYKLGCFYAGQGEGVVQADEALALRYKLIAAEAGYSLAQQDVAQIYMEKGDAAQTLRWLEAAARQGNSSALMGLSIFYSGEHRLIRRPRDAARSYAYSLLFLKQMGVNLELLKGDVGAELRKDISPEEIRQGEAIAEAWRAEPTTLTQKAFAGQEAASRLAATAPGS